jgi:hypothetical protein
MANTGKKIVLTLKEQQNPGSSDTGEVKNNVPSDADYVAPYTDTDECPIVYTDACPIVIFTKTGTQLEYEFSLPNAVVQNPVIKKIRVKLSAGGFQQTITLPNTTPNYFHGLFTGIDSGTTYTVAVDYLDNSNNVVKACV